MVQIVVNRFQTNCGIYAPGSNPYTIHIAVNIWQMPTSPVVVRGEVTTFDDPRDLFIKRLCFAGVDGCPGPLIGLPIDGHREFSPDFSVVTQAMGDSSSAGTCIYFICNGWSTSTDYDKAVHFCQKRNTH